MPEPQVEEKGKKSGNLVKDVEVFTVPVTRRRLVTEQRNDPSLVKCFSAAEHPKPVKDIKAEYVLDNELLLRKWRPVTGMSSDGILPAKLCCRPHTDSKCYVWLTIMICLVIWGLQKHIIEF